MQKFHERSAWGQVKALAVVMTSIGLPIGGAVLWAADTKIDEKYATDSDLKAVQEAVQRQVDSLNATVKNNTSAVTATSRSVDGLTLVVLDLQIDKVESSIRELEREKRINQDSWNTHDEAILHDKVKALDDMQRQRNALFSRVMMGHQPS